jgi:hypothetical protein
MTAKEYFYSIGFDLVEKNSSVIKYVAKDGLGNYQVIKFISGFNVIDIYWQKSDGTKLPYTFTITQKIYTAIKKQTNELWGI